jgi:hypothetical protein
MSNEKPAVAGHAKDGAAALGISVPAWRRDWINTGRIPTYDFGGRGESFLWADFHAAVAKVAAEQAANPALKQPHSTGGKLKAAGRVGNPWGKNGKPADVAVAEKKAAKGQVRK